MCPQQTVKTEIGPSKAICARADDIGYHTLAVTAGQYSFPWKLAFIKKGEIFAAEGFVHDSGV